MTSSQATTIDVDALRTPRSYLRIEPTTDPLDPELIETTITQLRALLSDDSGFRSGDPDLTAEILLVAIGESGPVGDRTLRYYVGITDEERLGALEQAFQRCFPTSYAITETTTTLADALRLPTDTAADTETESTADTRTDDQLSTHEPLTTDTNPDTATMDGGTEAIDTSPPTHTDYQPAGVEFRGVGERHDDWQTRLTPLTTFAGQDSSRWPLALVADALVDADVPIAFQALVQPKPDWRGDAQYRIDDLRRGEDTRGARILRYFVEPPDGEYGPRDVDDLGDETAKRVKEIREKDAQRSFTVNARAVALGTDSTTTETALEDLTTAFEGVTNSFYRIGTATASHGSDEAMDLFTRLCTREFHEQANLTRRTLHKLPGASNHSPAIVTDPRTVGAFCLLGGGHLPAGATRALATTPPERTGQRLPANEVLQPFVNTDGMPLVRPRTADGEDLDAEITLPPSLQQLHTVIIGRTGSGKSVVGMTGELYNHAATDGATIVFDSKGTGLPEEYLRTHFAEYGTLENVYRFECRRFLPAVPTLDIRPQLAVGISREEAVENVASHYEELLMAFMGERKYKEASYATDVLHNLVKAMFDPVHGSDAISHRALLAAAQRLQETGTPPPVSDPDLRNTFDPLSAADQRFLDAVMQGVRHRSDKATRDARLARLFDHVTEDVPNAFEDDSPNASPPWETDDEAGPNTATHGEYSLEDPRFDFADFLDEDCVIVIDTSGYRQESRRLLTLVLLSHLWTSLKRRAAWMPHEAELPLVNLHLEEAADIAGSGVLDDLLSQGRGFGLAVTLSMQFPSQIRGEHERAYWELINDAGTKVVGNVGVDHDLAASLATSEMPQQEVANRLRDLARGEWLVRLPGQFGERAPQPFVGTSLPLPEGHPDAEWEFSETESVVYEAQREIVIGRSRACGLDVTTTEAQMPGDAAGAANAGGRNGVEASGHDAVTEHVPADSTLPHTDRLPDVVEYNPDPHALECSACGNRYSPRVEGMRQAIECCHSLAEVERDDIPISQVDLLLSPTERANCEYTETQLRFMMAVYMAHQQRFDRHLEYDIVWDSMVRLKEYVGIDTDGVDELVEDGLLSVDCIRPYTLYTMTPDGRELLQVGHREGVAHGDGKGDLSESSLHVAMVEAGARYFEQEFVDGGESSAVEVRRYHDVEDGRLDAAVLDGEDEVVATLEAERSNNDTLRAVPADFDKMAAEEPERALWIVKNRSAAHEVLQALNEPPEGEPRVEKTYSENMPPRDFKIDEPGLTGMTTFQRLRGTLLDADGPVFPS
jgi:hypothetical protein